MDVGYFTNPVDKSTNQILRNLVEEENELQTQRDIPISTAGATGRTWSSLCHSYLGFNNKSNLAGGDALFRLPVRKEHSFPCDRLSISSSTTFQTSDQEIPAEIPKRIQGVAISAGNLTKTKKRKKMYKIKHKNVKNIKIVLPIKKQKIMQLKKSVGQIKNQTTKTVNKKSVRFSTNKIDQNTKEKVVVETKVTPTNNEPKNLPKENETKSLNKSKEKATVIPKAGVERVKIIKNRIQNQLNLEPKLKELADLKNSTNVTKEMTLPKLNGKFDVIEPISPRVKITQPAHKRMEMVKPKSKKKFKPKNNVTNDTKIKKIVTIKRKRTTNKRLKVKEQQSKTSELLDPIEVARIITEKIRNSQQYENPKINKFLIKNTSTEVPAASSVNQSNLTLDKIPRYPVWHI